MWGGGGLYFLTDRFDDFWIGTTLGKTLLGYYSRAYEFAHYPRRVIATPLLGVFNPVFAQLQGDRLRLSQAFYRATYIILRVSFLASGAFALVMPEFIHLVIGDNWAPMLLTFRLMLIYTLLDVIIVFGEGLLWAVGRPQQFQRITLAQAVFFVPAVVLGARLWQINGVALAADAVLGIGCVILYKYLRQVVDFSLVRLTFWPVLSLTFAWVGGWLMETRQLISNPWQMAAAKLVLFGTLYAVLLGIKEAKEVVEGLRWAWQHLRAGRSGATPETEGD
jgi:PST family polysaccharide transporter